MTRCGYHCPSARCSMAAKFGTCRMIHLGLWIVDESCGPARALRARGGQPMDNIRVAHRLPTLSGSRPQAPQAQQQNYRKNDALTQSTLRVFN